MEGNMDQHIREKLREREIQPSASAWERLASQLEDAESKKKRHWFFYVGYAASILLLISLIFVMSKDDENKSPIPENVIVNEDNSKPQLDKTKEFISVPEEEVLVNNDNLEQKPEVIKEETNQIKNKELKKSPIVKFNSDKTSVAENTKKNVPKIDVQKKIKELAEEKEIVIVDNTFNKKKPTIRNSRISVDSDALLMSVTSTKEELRAYYKKYKIDRRE